MGKQYNKVQKRRRRERRLKRKKEEAASLGLRTGRAVRPRVAARPAGTRTKPASEAPAAT